MVKVAVPATAADNKEEFDYYIYNAAGQLIWVQSSSTSSRTVYEYNEQGQATKKTTMSWVPADRAFKELNSETYTYDANGNVEKMEQYTNIGTTYSRHYIYNYTSYENGIATSATMEDVRAENSYKYDYKTTIEYDAQNRIVKKTTEEYDYDYPDDGFCAYESYEYSYKDNGDIDTERYKTYNYAYDKVKKDITYTYTYADLDASFAPTGLSATINGSSILLSWDEVAGATDYVVTYDLEHKIVNGSTSFIASDIAVGEHTFTVQAIVNGEEKNAANPVTACVVDPGKLPAQNLAVGECTKTVEETETGDVTFFVLPLTWSIPNGHSEIKDIRVYFNDEYKSIDSKTATSYDLKLYEWQIRNTDENGDYTDGKEFEIAVVLVYGSGEAEKSNIVVVNPYKQTDGGNIEDAISAVSTKTKSVKYNLSGLRVNNSYRGIIIQDGRKVLR